MVFAQDTIRNRAIKKKKTENIITTGLAAPPPLDELLCTGLDEKISPPLPPLVCHGLSRVSPVVGTVPVVVVLVVGNDMPVEMLPTNSRCAIPKKGTYPSPPVRPPRKDLCIEWCDELVTRLRPRGGVVSGDMLSPRWLPPSPP
eukprot:CAMPEP_0201865872 /NCGR_PEP_ID=MMETSP0902-20130614/653_1 /ASSEMBLY_ACC=CAM_ASM_000551 /TAXON_ID=420261 /ORGANISM="Thalassiosira antarctica, Strain CCMP982" /LENGTH=143 /DNA_ID=CAMNT_0048390737 /DNA_START=25 /DNA_END=456 /DNA_ORIENTATION=-